MKKREIKFSKDLIKKVFIIDGLLLVMVAALYLFLPEPHVVDGLSVTGGTFQTVDLKWRKSAKAKGYRVYRSTDGKNYEYMGSTGENKFTDYNTRTGTTYYYAVSARNGVATSDLELNKAVKATPELETPKLSIDTTKGEMQLSYSRIDGAVSYEIIRDGKKIDETMETTYVDKDAEDDETHKYEVKAVRYKKDPVYSAASNSSEAELHCIPNFKIEAETEDLFIDWDPSDYYTKYKVMNGDKVLAESEDTSYTLEGYEHKHTYDIKVVGFSEDDKIQSPARERRFQVFEEPMDNEGAKKAACDWGVKIANDDSFAYGTGDRAHRCGCYFCGTNRARKGAGYEKTYCCNPFVHACYAHGAGDPDMLSTCQGGGAAGMNRGDWTRYGFVDVGKPSISDLEAGDVLVGSHHVMLYIGDGMIVHAKQEGWGAGTITTDSCSSFYGSFTSFVMRYTGDGSGTMNKIRDVDENDKVIKPPKKEKEEGEESKDEDQAA